MLDCTLQLDCKITELKLSRAGSILLWSIVHGERTARGTGNAPQAWRASRSGGAPWRGGSPLRRGARRGCLPSRPLQCTARAASAVLLTDRLADSPTVWSSSARFPRVVRVVWVTVRHGMLPDISFETRRLLPSVRSRAPPPANFSEYVHSRGCLWVGSLDWSYSGAIRYREWAGLGRLSLSPTH